MRRVRSFLEEEKLRVSFTQPYLEDLQNIRVGIRHALLAGPNEIMLFPAPSNNGFLLYG